MNLFKTSSSSVLTILLSFITSSQSFTTTFFHSRTNNIFLSSKQSKTYNFNSKSLLSTSSSSSTTKLYETTEEEQIVSPFENNDNNSSDDEILELTWDNVDIVLEEMRPYLIQDGGNVKIDDIDGPVVKLQLEGACGTCPSSTQTMKMGLERRLRERIPEIQEVIQAMPEGPPLSTEEVDVVLDTVRPFLSVAGGTIECDSISGEMSVQPVINLKMGGSSASLNSVKLEISQRLQRHFMLAGLRVEWVE